MDWERKPGRRWEKRFDDKHQKSQNHGSSRMVQIYEETQDYFNMAGIDVPPSKLIDIIDLDIEDCEMYIQPTSVKLTNVEVINCDTLDAAILLKEEGYSLMALNMASKFKPGGGVATGKTAQEEVIFRRTNAFMTYDPEWYPLGHNEVIYSPEVVIAREGAPAYKFIPNGKQKTVSMLAVHALKNPKLTPSGEYKEIDRKLMITKIESIFKIGIKQQADSLVLGALGCGAYRNPPYEVVKIFKDCLEKYQHYFKKIVFAILSINDDNYNIFYKELTQ